AGFEQEDGGVGTVQQTTRDHAARGACADDHVVVTSGEHLAALNLAMKLNHGQCLLHESAWDVSAADVRHSPGSSGPRRQAEEAHVIPPRQLQRGGQWRARLEPAPGTTRSRRTGALGDTGPRPGAPDSPTGDRRGEVRATRASNLPES